MEGGGERGGQGFSLHDVGENFLDYIYAFFSLNFMSLNKRPSPFQMSPHPHAFSLFSTLKSAFQLNSAFKIDLFFDDFLSMSYLRNNFTPSALFSEGRIPFQGNLDPLHLRSAVADNGKKMTIQSINDLFNDSFK